MVVVILTAIYLVSCGKPAPTASSTHRIVCTYSPAMELAFALRLHPYLVGIAKNTHHLVLYRTLLPGIDQLTVVGSKIGGVNLETISSLKPTLVISFAGSEGSRTSQKLAQLGIPSEVVTMESLAEIRQSLQRLGERTGVMPQVQIVEAEMNRILALVDLAVSQKPPADHPAKVYFASSRSLFTTQSNKMLQHEMIERAGAQDVVDTAVGGWVSISAEQLLLWDPDLIVISKEAIYSLDSLTKDPRLQVLKAVKNGKLYQIPDAIIPWDFPGPDVVLGILWLASTCYPERFAKLDLAAEKNRYYQTIYGVPYHKLATGH